MTKLATKTFGSKHLYRVDDVPAFAASIGSIALDTNGRMYVKTGAGNTDWSSLDLHSSNYPFTAAERLADVLDDLGLVDSTCKLLWSDGDGTSPEVGPTLTTVGTPVPGQSTGLVDVFGNPITSESYDGASYRYSATPLDPALGEDVVALALVDDRQSSTGYAMATRDTGNGWAMLLGPTGVSAYCTVGGTFNNIVTSAYRYTLCVLMASPGNTMTIWTPEDIHTKALPAGSFADATTGINIGSRPGGGNELKSNILGVAAFYGVGFAAQWAASSYERCWEVLRRVTGTKESVGDAAILARATVAAWQGDSGIWVMTEENTPRAGNDNGLTLEPARTNKAYNNVGPDATTGWSVTGGTHDTTDDATALSSAKADTWGPSVHRFAPGAGDEVIYGGAVTGAGPATHSISLLIRGDAGGESVDVGLRDSSSGAVQNAQTVVLTTAYQLVQIHGVTPADTDQQFALDCDAGDTILFIGAQLEAGERCSTLIPNLATAATATRDQDVVTLGDTPGDTQGSIALTVTPDGWSAAEAGTVSLLSRETGSPASLTCTSGTWQAALDGTTVLDSGVAPADGVAHTLRLRWTGSAMSLEVRLESTGALLARDDDTYDGALDGSGAWTLAAGATVTVRAVKTYNHGKG